MRWMVVELGLSLCLVGCTSRTDILGTQRVGARGAPPDDAGVCDPGLVVCRGVCDTADACAIDAGSQCIATGDQCTDLSRCCDPTARCDGMNGGPGHCVLNLHEDGGAQDTGSPDANDGGTMCVASGDTCTDLSQCCDPAEHCSGMNGAPGHCVQAVGCGANTCGANAICVHPCCGGPLPQCVPMTDAGGCPPGTSLGMCFMPGAGPMDGCTTTCTPPAPFCAPVPQSCGGTATCSCLPGNVCNGAGSCGLINAEGVECVCA
jgi:hypothetical protein